MSYVCDQLFGLTISLIADRINTIVICCVLASGLEIVESRIQSLTGFHVIQFNDRILPKYIERRRTGEEEVVRMRSAFRSHDFANRRSYKNNCNLLRARKRIGNSHGESIAIFRQYICTGERHSRIDARLFIS